MATLRFGVLGPLTVERDDAAVSISGRRQRALLLLLLLARGRAVQVDRLIDDLWAGDPPPSANATLQTYVSLLRRAFGDKRQAVLVREASGYRVATEPGALDVERFEALVVAAAEAEAPAALDLLTEALGMWRGPALVDVIDEPFAQAESARLEELRLAAVEDRFQRLLDLGRDVEAVPGLEATVAEHPLRERLTALLAQALYRSERQADALHAIERTRNLLGDELGLVPGPELLRLEQAILEHHPLLSAPRAPRVLGAAVTSIAAAPTRPTPVTLPLPAGMPARRHRFVGRDAELAWLRAQWARAAGGAKRLSVLDGEPGIGKTRLASRLAEEVHEAGAMVLWGRCSAEQLTAYQPVIESLREVILGLQRAGRKVILGAHEGLRLLVPDVVGPPESTADPTAERFRLFEAVASLVHGQSQLRPVLFVIDDLHWIDPATAALLTHVLRHPEPGALLVLGTARTVDAGDALHFADLVADLRRDRLVDRRTVEGLDEVAAARLVQLAGGGALAGRADEVHHAAAGNPFFIEELAAHLAESGEEPTAVPDSVREVIDRRLARLGEDPIDVLAAASVLGDQFDIDVLEAVTERHDELLDVVDEARDAGLVHESAEALGRYGFVHALVRQTLTARLSRTRLARLHLGAAEALEAASTTRAEYQFEIAAHRLAALPAGDPSLAVETTVRAGHQALQNLAYEDAGHLGGQAAAVLAGELERERPDLAAEVALLRAEAARTLGQLEAAQAWVDEAAATAREQTLPDVLSRAALAAAATRNTPIGFQFGRLDEPLTQLFEEALAVEEDPARRVRLLAALATALYTHPDPSRRMALSSEAVELAERLGEDGLLATALTAHATVLWTAPTMHARVANLERAHGLAERARHDDLDVRVRIGLINSLVELGSLDRAEEGIDRLADLVERLHQPTYLIYPDSCRVVIDLLRGRYDDAAETIERVQAATSTLYVVNTRNLYDARRFALARDRRGLQRLVPLFEDLAATTEVLVRRLTATMVLALGGGAGAEQQYEDVIDLPVPDDAIWLSTLATKCELVRAFGDGRRAEGLLDAMRPYAGRLVCNATAVSTGGVSRYLGIAAHVAGRLDEADAWFERAADEHRAWGARPWLARTFADHADLLRDRRAPGDEARAGAYEAEAREEAAAIGLHDPFTRRP